MIYKFLVVALFLSACVVGENYELVKEKKPEYIVLEFDPLMGGDNKNLFKAKQHCNKYGKDAKFHRYIDEKPKFPQNVIVMYECYDIKAAQ
jgi:hypothetical protein